MLVIRGYNGELRAATRGEVQGTQHIGRRLQTPGSQKHSVNLLSCSGMLGILTQLIIHPDSRRAFILKRNKGVVLHAKEKKDVVSHGGYAVAQFPQLPYLALLHEGTPRGQKKPDSVTGSPVLWIFWLW